MKPQLPGFFAWEMMDLDPSEECLRGILRVTLPWKIVNIETCGSHMTSSLDEGNTDEAGKIQI